MEAEYSDTVIRNQPIIHDAVDPPQCPECATRYCDANDGVFFDSSCSNCLTYILNEATISELFAILRQWVQPVQQAISIIICQMLDLGAHVNDRDGLTDMTMLHYAVKSGARGMGNPNEACKTCSLLLSRGADPYIRCRWTNMAAIHYAVYFDSAQVLKLLLNVSKAVDIDSLCSEFDLGTPLHIACRALSLESAQILIDQGANPNIPDSNIKLPIDFLPALSTVDSNDHDRRTIVEKIKNLLETSKLSYTSLSQSFLLTPRESLHVAKAMQTIGIRIGDKVYVGGVKTGMLRYCGPTLFANGLWTGIELDEAIGKNNGTIDGIQYFKCPPNYGIFAPISKISKFRSQMQSAVTHSNLFYSRMDLSHVVAKVNTWLKQSRNDLTENGGFSEEELEVGDRVVVAGRKYGTIKFKGETKFSPGLWYGVELDEAVGKNDGAVDGVQYFTCPPQHGVFAPPTRVQRLIEDGSTLDRTSHLSYQKTPESTPKLTNGIRISSKTPLNRSKTFNTITRPPTSWSANNSNSELRLTEGRHVYCNGELGTLCYVGSVDFAEGTWLGVELRTPQGKHDGMVQGKKKKVPTATLR